MTDIQYDPACMDCRHDAAKDPSGTTWQCAGHVRAERDWLRARLAVVMAVDEEDKIRTEILQKEAAEALSFWKERALAAEARVREARASEEWLAFASMREERDALKTERNAALTLAEQRGAAYDMTWREVESLRERLDKEGEERGRQYGLRAQAEAEVERLTDLVQHWYEGRARIGAHMTFVDQRLYDAVRCERTGWPGDDADRDGGPPEEK